MFRVYFILILCLVVLISPTARAQDSLYLSYYKLTKNDTASLRKKALLLENIIEKEIHGNSASVLSKMDTLASLYKILGDSAMYNWARYHYKGFFYATHDDQIKALQYYQQYAKVFKRETEKDGYFLIDVGNLYYSLHLFGLSRKYYEEAEVVFKGIGHARGLTTVYGNYSLVAKNLGQLDTAFHYIYKTLDIQKTLVRDSFQIAHTYHVIARLYSEQKADFAASIPNYLASVQLLQQQPKEHLRYPQFIHLLPYGYQRLGASYCNMGKKDSCFSCLEEAIRTARQIGQMPTLVGVLTGAGKTYIEQGLDNKALPLLLEAEELSNKYSVQTIKTALYLQLKKIYTNAKNYDKVVQYWEKYNALKDSLRGQEDDFLLMNDQILQQERNNTIQEQEKVINAEQDLKRRLVIILALIGLLLLLVLLFWWQLQRKNKLVTQYSKDLEASNTVKELMLMVIGHDMRSLFNSILGNSNQLLHNLRNKELSRLERNTEQINIAAKKAYMTMDGLMQWVVLQKEEIKPQVHDCFLEPVLEQTTQQLASLLEAANLRINADLDGVSVLSDPRLLQIILRNLLTNAIKHSPPSSVILVRAKQSGKELCLRVEDSGIGLSQEIMETLKQKGDAGEIARKGSGLGLEIVKRLCLDLGIQLDFFNKKPNGAVFELILPIGTQQRAASAAASTIATKKLLSAADLAQLRPHIQELRKLEFFEGTAIHRVLASIQQPSPAVQLWLAALREILSLNDEQAYKAKLEEVQ